MKKQKTISVGQDVYSNNNFSFSYGYWFELYFNNKNKIFKVVIKKWMGLFIKMKI